MIKLFEDFNKHTEIVEWLDKMDIENYTINEDLTVDVNGDVNLYNSNTGLVNIPIQFGIVTGNFAINNNGLTSLKGSPEYVGEYFYCNSNKLTSLEGCPKRIMGGFDARYNYLTTLEFCPEKVGSYFDCTGNMISTLKGFATEVFGEVSLDENPLPPEVCATGFSMIVKYQNEYGLWNDNGSFNHGRFKIFQQDLVNNVIP